MKSDILGIKFNNEPIDSLLGKIEGFIKGTGRHIVITANPEIIMLSKSDMEFQHILEKADIITADGVGIILAAKILGLRKPARVAGIDLVSALFARSANKGFKIFLLGAKEGIAEKAKINIEKNYPDIRIVGVHHGYFDKEDEIINQIKKVNPDILLVAMGMGRQEKWIWANKDRLGCHVYIGVGGSFDVMAGVAKRAPLWMQKAGLEWFFRLIKEPTRIGRMLVLPKFLVRVIIERIRR